MTTDLHLTEAQVATHEAGHVMAYFAVGWPFDHVTLDPENLEAAGMVVVNDDDISNLWPDEYPASPAEERRSREFWLKWFVVNFAGIEAERIAGFQHNREDDAEGVIRALEMLDAPSLEDAWRLAAGAIVLGREMLKAEWSSVEAIRDALLERRLISERECRAILDGLGE